MEMVEKLKIIWKMKAVLSSFSTCHLDCQSVLDWNSCFFVRLLRIFTGERIQFVARVFPDKKSCFFFQDGS